KARIQVVPARQGAAPIEVWADDRGYFTIVGLERGQPYYLTARVKNGDRLLAASVQAAPNNLSLLLEVSEEKATPDTPPVPEPRTPPGSEPARPDKPEPKKDPKPAASADPPAASREIRVIVPPAPPEPRRPPRKDHTVVV